MATQRCEVIRRQKPPYHWKFASHHVWRKIAGTGGKILGCCVHCGLFPDEVRCGEHQVKPDADSLMGVDPVWGREQFLALRDLAAAVDDGL